MQLPSISEIERQIREFRSMILKLRRADGVFGGTRGATCTVCLWVKDDEVFVGDVDWVSPQHEHSRYGSEVVPRLGVAFDVKAAARRLREAAEKGLAALIHDGVPVRTG